MRADDGASRWQILIKIVLPLAIPGLISAFISASRCAGTNSIYALTFLQSTQNKTVPVAIVNEFRRRRIFIAGILMAGALAGSLPLVILYAFSSSTTCRDDRSRERVTAQARV